LLISDERDPISGKDQDLRQGFAGKSVVLYRPRSLLAGMGCRRGVPLEELERLLVDTFHGFNLSLDSLGCIATAELKRNEPGLQDLAEKYGVSLVCFSSDRLNSVFPSSREEAADDTSAFGEEAGGVPGLTRSEKAHSLLGIWGVAEPAALLASGSNRLLVPKQKGARATVAVARQKY
jgi:cobalt-precorrin 5A hydrolase